MPEQTSEPQTDRVDAAFDALLDEVGASSHPPGAKRAIRTVNARRTAFVASAVVVVLTVVAGLGTWQPDRVGVPVVAPPSEVASGPPTTSSSTDPGVPAPKTLSLDRLNRASEGWVVWEEGTADVTDVAPCMVKGAPLPEDRHSTNEHYDVQATTDAYFERMTLRSRTASNQALRTLIEGVESCPDQTHVHNVDFSANLEVVAYTWGTGQRRGVIWLVNFGNRVDIFQVVGVPEPSDDVLRQISALLAADVQVP